MIITQLQPGKRDDQRVNVFLDGKFWKALELTTMMNYGLQVGQNLEADQLDKMLNEDQLNWTWRRVYSWWLGRPRSRFELSQKFRLLATRRQLDAGLWVQLEAKLEAHEMTDLQFADWFVQQRAAQGRYGRQRVLAELLSKKVDRLIANKALQAGFADHTTQLHTQVTKKFGKLLSTQQLAGFEESLTVGLRGISDYDLRSKVYRFLKSRGF